MADPSTPYPGTSLERTTTFHRQMVKDFPPSQLGEGVWTHAVNAVNQTHAGEQGALSNEAANRLVARVPYDLIGAIPLTGDRWVLFSTDDINCEIGVFDDSAATYRTVVNDPGLQFRRAHLISGAARKTYDCQYSVYWADGLNPDRKLTLEKVPYKRKPVKKPLRAPCTAPEYTNELDVEALRLSRLVTTPSLELRKGFSGGSLPNGSYQVVLAYTIASVRVTDYFLPSNVQSLFDHRNGNGSLELEVLECDQQFDTFELVLLSMVNQQTVARRIGTYSTRQRVILIDQLKENLPVVPLEWIPLVSPAWEKSDAIYTVNDYLLRTGVYTRPEINWQPLVNQMVTKWVAVEVPADYYNKGGNLTGYLRDEIYAFFIRGVYNTGDRTSCYPIPGRVAESTDLSIASGQDVFEMQLKTKPAAPLRRWQVENTAKITSNQVVPQKVGTIIAEGTMGYHESTERYPDDRPEVWGPNCGQPIRHHRMPDNELVPVHTRGGHTIVLLGVRFENIRHPVDLDGKPVTSIVGYEVLRASREGNKTIIAKGLLNTVGEYDLPEGSPDRKGLYPNFPFNDIRPNSLLSKDPVKGGCQGKGYAPLEGFSKQVFTFHSPETQFRHPFLNATELKIHQELTGTVTGSFDPVFKHPRHRLIRDLALVVAGLVGVGTGLLAIKGKKTITRSGPRAFNVGITGGGATNITTLPVGGGVVQGYYAGKGVADLLKDVGLSVVDINDFLGKLGKTTDPSYVMGSTPGVMGGSMTTSTDNSAVSELPLPLRIAGGTFLFTYFFSQGTDEALRILRNLIPYQQYARQMNAHGFYHTAEKTRSGNRRRYIQDSAYLGPYLQEFTPRYRVNNLYRSRQVLVEVHRPLEPPRAVDNSRTSIGELRQWDDPGKPFVRATSAYYASLKIPLAAQYGQLESAVLLPVSGAVLPADLTPDARVVSGVLFGGDIYINRYTEKNSFPFFNQWMQGDADGTEWDYNQYYNVPHPRYWVNTTQYEITNLTSALIRFNFKENVLPNDFAQLDRPSGDCKSNVSFVINKAFFYLFFNGVRDFFVESEINTAHRDWGDQDAERHYDAGEFTDLGTLFRSDIIKSGNHFAYDFSLSTARLVHNYISWGQVQPRDFDPLVAARCYSYFPQRVIYSLPQAEALKKDNWSAFLANNYKDFSSRVTAIHAVGASGALIFLEDRSPVQFTGVDQLQTTGGTKITIGDGGLFEQPLQAVSNADAALAYGACRHRMSIINTPAGLFWISQEQGKIFQYTAGLEPISSAGMKHWFNQHLPSKLLKDFPDFTLTDNPVIGIGCMAVYDALLDTVYFCKKDYQLREEYRGKLTYDKDHLFLWRGRTRVYLGDPTYFEPASWTLSYDMAVKGWISFHDWLPDYLLPSPAHFFSVQGGRIWKHHDRCDGYANFYGKDYPFEVEFAVQTGAEVSTLRSVEYILECYQYDRACSARHHLLDVNFDRAMVFNSEQHSGLLKLLPKPKNQPYLLTEAPVVNLNGVDSFFTKEENKYRINGFFDLTRNRSEFDDQYLPLWTYAANGYQKTINDRAISYSKAPVQRKKFRHYQQQVLLRRTVSKDIQMVLKLAITKHLKSPR